jgi:hypothetical protein
MQNSSYLLHPPDLNSVAAAAVIASQNRNRRRTRIKFDAEQVYLFRIYFKVPFWDFSKEFPSYLKLLRHLTYFYHLNQPALKTLV